MNIRVNSPLPQRPFISNNSVPLEILEELGQATTAYHEAPPDRLASARKRYEMALKKMQLWQSARE